MSDSLFSLADRRLAWLDKRQTLLAQNIANADTPKFHAKDLTPFADQLSAAHFAGAPTRTNALHMSGTSEGAALVTTPPAQRSATGNTVNIEGELVKVADTDASQELVGDLYKKYLNLYRIALGR